MREFGIMTSSRWTVTQHDTQVSWTCCRIQPIRWWLWKSLSVLYSMYQTFSQSQSQMH